MYIVIINDSKLNLNETHELFGKTFIFKGENPRQVLGDFMRSLKKTSDILNKELDLYYKVDPIQHVNELDRRTKFF